MFKKALVAAAVSTIAATAFASAEQTPKLSTAIPPVLKNAQQNGGLTVQKDFKAAGGLTGWVVVNKSENKPLVVYTTPDGEVLLAGMAMDKDGKNLTALYAEAHVPPPDHSEAIADFTKDGASSGVVIGSKSAKAEITVLFDANCGFCKLMHGLVQPAIDAGELRVRYVPVGILGADSTPKGAAMLESKNPTKLVEAMASGGKVEVSNDKALQAKVKANTDLMRKHGINGTPTVLYTAKDAKGVETDYVSNGLPNMLSLFKQLGINGQVEKLQADPKLKQYLR